MAIQGQQNTKSHFSCTLKLVCIWLAYLILINELFHFSSKTDNAQLSQMDPAAKT
jgi:hypothetical protein